MITQHTTLLLLSGIALGSYVQAVTGFALGLIFIGFATALEILPVTAAAAVITLTAPVNIFIALHKRHHQIDWRIFRGITIGQLPAIIAGVILVDYLSREHIDTLQIIVGTIIVVSALLLLYKPHPTLHHSPIHHSVIAGLLAGLLGWMFSTGAPPLVYYLYRQPLSLEVVRNTLLAVFILGIAIRGTTILFHDHITTDVIQVALYSIPIIVLFTWLGKRFPPPLKDIAMRRTAFGLLLLFAFSGPT